MVLVVAAIHQCMDLSRGATAAPEVMGPDGATGVPGVMAGT